VVAVLAALVAPRRRHTLCLTERDRVACASCPRLIDCRPLAAAAGLVLIAFALACGTDPTAGTTTRSLTACECYDDAARAFHPADCIPPEGMGPNGEPGVAWVAYCPAKKERPEPPVLPTHHYP
ncbi:MAG: hypothetical protein ACJ79E_18095, partial [Anaeromyxobacteraceae bacterium]